MWSQEQIDAMAELEGRHAADRFKLAMKQGSEQRALFETQGTEIKETMARLGIVTGEEIPGPALASVPAFTGIPPEGEVGAPIPMVIPPPAPIPLVVDGLVGTPVATTLSVGNAGRPLSPTPMPRPLNQRK
jgi:hypothetical protein